MKSFAKSDLRYTLPGQVCGAVFFSLSSFDLVPDVLALIGERHGDFEV